MSKDEPMVSIKELVLSAMLEVQDLIKILKEKDR